MVLSRNIRRLGPWALLALGTLAAFAPMFQNNFVWDDQDFIVKNKAIRGLWPPGRFLEPQARMGEGGIYPLTGHRPVMAFSLALDYAVWKLNPFGYHLSNFLLHLLCIACASWLVNRLARNPVVAYLSGALFALHPGHAEAVIAFLGRSDLLAAGFTLAGFGLYLGQREITGWGKILRYAGALGCFSLACFAKETGLVLLGLLLVYEGFVVRGERSRPLSLRSKTIHLLPFGLLAWGYWSYRGWILGGQAAGAEWWGGGAASNFLMSFEIFARYLKLLFFPFSLSPLHLIPAPRGLGDLRVLAGFFLFAASLSGTLWALYRRPRVGMWASFFLLGLVPIANWVPIPGVTNFAERWFYLGSLGGCVLGGWAALTLFQRARGWTKGAWTGLAAVAFCLFGVRIFTWAPVWKTEESLARTMVETSPEGYVGRNNLGYLLMNQGRLAEAEIQLREAVRLRPNYSLAHNNLGTVLRRQGRYPEAEAAYRNAIESNPRDAQAHSNLGIVLIQQGEPREAQREFREAVRLDPNRAEFHYNLGIALGRAGEPQPAEQALRETIRLDPGFADAFFNLGLALEEQGRLREAMEAYGLYLGHRPGAPERIQVEAKIRLLAERVDGDTSGK